MISEMDRRVSALEATIGKILTGQASPATCACGVTIPGYSGGPIVCFDCAGKRLRAHRSDCTAAADEECACGKEAEAPQ